MLNTVQRALESQLTELRASSHKKDGQVSSWGLLAKSSQLSLTLLCCQLFNLRGVQGTFYGSTLHKRWGLLNQTTPHWTDKVSTTSHDSQVGCCKIVMYKQCMVKTTCMLNTYQCWLFAGFEVWFWLGCRLFKQSWFWAIATFVKTFPTVKLSSCGLLGNIRGKQQNKLRFWIVKYWSIYQT